MPDSDADLLARHLPHDHATVVDRVRDVANYSLPNDDGVDYLTETITVQTIREDADYAGVRITMDCRVSTAAVKLKLDVNVGDPVTPAPQLIELPSQRPDTPAVTVLSYPIETVLPKKPAQRSPSAKPTRGYVTMPTCTPLPADTPCPTPGCAKPCWRPRDTELSPCYRFPTSSAHSPRYGSLLTIHFDDASVPMAHTCL